VCAQGVVLLEEIHLCERVGVGRDSHLDTDGQPQLALLEVLLPANLHITRQHTRRENEHAAPLLGQVIASKPRRYLGLLVWRGWLDAQNCIDTRVVKEVRHPQHNVLLLAGGIVLG
jgi:hypothetical protein